MLSLTVALAACLASVNEVENLCSDEVFLLLVDTDEKDSHGTNTPYLYVEDDIRYGEKGSLTRGLGALSRVVV